MSRQAPRSLTATSALTCAASVGSGRACGVSDDSLGGQRGSRSPSSMTEELEIYERRLSFSFRNTLLSRESLWEHLNPQGLFRSIGSKLGMPKSAVPRGTGSPRLKAREIQESAQPKAVPLHPHRTLAKLSAKMAPEFMRPKEALK